VRDPGRLAAPGHHWRRDFPYPMHNGCPGACVDNRQHAAYRHNEYSHPAEPRRLSAHQYEIKTDKIWNPIQRRGKVILSLVFLSRIKQTTPLDNFQVILGGFSLSIT